jgi:hypothetical protein
MRGIAYFVYTAYVKSKAPGGINPVLTCRKQIRRARRQADCIGGHRTPPTPQRRQRRQLIEAHEDVVDSKSFTGPLIAFQA